MNQRNYSIDLLKLYFACCVALGHSHLPSILPTVGMDYVVTLFFILSGFFLVRSFDSGKYADPWQYTMSRICRIWPYYFAALVALFLYTNLSADAGVVEMARNFSRLLPEILMVQNIGVFPEGINFPTWQLSTLIFASHLLFALLAWNRQTALNLVCPMAAACIYVCLGQDIEIWGTVGYFFCVPVLRAVAGLSLGMFLHDPIGMLLKKLEKSSLASLVLTVGAVVMALLLWLNRDHATMLILPFIGLLICLLHRGTLWARLLRHPALRCLDKISLGIYMNHVLFIRILEHNPWLLELGLPMDLCYLAAVMLFSTAIMWIVDGFQKKIAVMATP